MLTPDPHLQAYSQRPPQGECGIEKVVDTRQMNTLPVQEQEHHLGAIDSSSCPTVNSAYPSSNIVSTPAVTPDEFHPLEGLPELITQGVGSNQEEHRPFREHQIPTLSSSTASGASDLSLQPSAGSTRSIPSTIPLPESLPTSFAAVTPVVLPQEASRSTLQSPTAPSAFHRYIHHPSLQRQRSSSQTPRQPQQQQPPNVQCYQSQHQRSTQAVNPPFVSPLQQQQQQQPHSHLPPLIGSRPAPLPPHHPYTTASELGHWLTSDNLMMLEPPLPVVSMGSPSSSTLDVGVTDDVARVSPAAGTSSSGGSILSTLASRILSNKLRPLGVDSAGANPTASAASEGDEGVELKRVRNSSEAIPKAGIPSPGYTPTISNAQFELGCEGGDRPLATLETSAASSRDSSVPSFSTSPANTASTPANQSSDSKGTSLGTMGKATASDTPSTSSPHISRRKKDSPPHSTISGGSRSAVSEFKAMLQSPHTRRFESVHQRSSRNYPILPAEEIVGLMGPTSFPSFSSATNHVPPRSAPTFVSPMSYHAPLTPPTPATDSLEPTTTQPSPGEPQPTTSHPSPATPHIPNFNLLGPSPTLAHPPSDTLQTPLSPSPLPQTNAPHVPTSYLNPRGVQNGLDGSPVVEGLEGSGVDVREDNVKGRKGWYMPSRFLGMGASTSGVRNGRCYTTEMEEGMSGGGGGGGGGGTGEHLEREETSSPGSLYENVWWCFGRKVSKRKQAGLIAFVLTLLTGIAIAVPLFLNLKGLEFNRSLATLRTQCMDVYDSMTSELSGPLNIPNAFRWVFDSTPASSNMTLDEYQAYLSNYPILARDQLARQVVGISWAQRVTRSERAQYESQRGIIITEQRDISMPFGLPTDSADLVPRSVQDVYFPLTLVMKGNERFVGVDITSEPVRKTTLEDALRIRNLAVSQAVSIDYQNKTRLAIRFVLPWYDIPYNMTSNGTEPFIGSNSPISAEPLKKETLGVFSGVVFVGEALTTTLSSQSHNLSILLTDNEDSAVILDWRNGWTPDSLEAPPTNPPSWPITTEPLNIENRNYTFRCYGAPSTTDSPITFFALLMVVTVALATLLTLFLYRFLKARKEAKSTRGWLEMERKWGRMVRLKAGAVLGALDDPVLVIGSGGWIVGRNQKALEVCWGGTNRHQPRMIHVSEVFEDGWPSKNGDEASMPKTPSTDPSSISASHSSAPPLPDRHRTSISHTAPSSSHAVDLTSWSHGWITRGTRRITVKRHDGTWFEAEATFSAVEIKEEGQGGPQIDVPMAGNTGSDDRQQAAAQPSYLQQFMTSLGLGGSSGANFNNQSRNQNPNTSSTPHSSQQTNGSVGSGPHTNPATTDGKMWVVVFRDVSARLMAERDLVIAKEAAEKANQEKSEFLAWICHELRNPLHAVVGLTDMLLMQYENEPNSPNNTKQSSPPLKPMSRPLEEIDDQKGAELVSHLTSICNSARLMSTIINDVLDLSKLQAGKMQLDCIPVDLLEVLRDCCSNQAAAGRWSHVRLGEERSATAGANMSSGDMGRGVGQVGNVDLYYELKSVDASGAFSRTPCKVLVDPTRLQQILINLISNSLKFTSTGHVTVRGLILQHRYDSASHIPSTITDPVMSPKHQVLVRFEVEDTGIGVAKEDIPKLFKAYSQANASIGRNFGGTGLGLSIVQKLVSIMGGIVHVESTLGVGTTVSFDIWMDMVDEGPRQSLSKDGNAISTSKSPALFTCCSSSAHSVQPMDDQHATDVSCIDFTRKHTDSSTASLKSVPGVIPPILETATPSNGADNVDESHLSSITLNVKEPSKSNQKTPEPKSRTSSACRSSAAAEPEKPSASPVAKKEPLRVLLTEDNALLQNIAKTMLTKAGFLVAIAGNGVEAFDLLTKHGERNALALNDLDPVEREGVDETVQQRWRDGFDICLMDLQMPVMDGFEATLKIREAGFKLPIIALTANATAGDRQQCLASGFNEFLTKPFRLAQISKVLMEAMKSSQVDN
ncbi:hypothetical protein HDV05_007025 [Chytridiales sp. JEL 0842]|nr:hypothetical protein HDV05_007025 [Chytridiales sp. JEL 0842]